MKLYTLFRNGKYQKSKAKGKYAGYRRGKIFGRLDCKNGMRMKKENRVFFRSLEDAVREGYRPCRDCRPVNEVYFQRIKHLTPYKTLYDFYNKDRR